MSAYIPREYQHEAAEFIIDHPACALFAEMGLGKTAITLDAIHQLITDYLEIRRVLIVAPLRVATISWPDEMKKWGFDKQLSSVVLHNDVVRDKKYALLNMAPKVDLTFINYDGLKFLAKMHRYVPKYDMLVIDESTFVKNQNTIRFKILRSLAQVIPRKVLLTGTPAPNSLLDLWSQFFLLDQGERLQKSHYAYKHRYFMQIDHMGYKWALKRGAKEEITDQIGDITMILRAEDYLEMPDLKFPVIKAELPKKLREEYNTLEDDFFLELDGEAIEVFNTAALAMKLRQYIAGFVYNGDGRPIRVHDQRLKILTEMIEALNGKPLLCCVQFKEEIAMIREYFKKDLPAIYSGTTGKQSTQHIRAWNKGEIPLLLVHPASVGHGLNLQSGGCHILWFSMTWSLEHYDQTKSRLWRSGQEADEVIVYSICVEDTIDEVIAEAIRSKNRTQQSLIKRLKEWRAR